MLMEQTAEVLDSIASSSLVGAVAGESTSESCASGFCVASKRLSGANLALETFAAPITLSL